MTVAPSAAAIPVFRLDRSHVPAVQAFLRRHYGERFYGAEERYFDWQYLQVPCDWFRPEAAAGAIPVNAVVDNDFKIMAVHAFIPFDARTPWGGARGVWDSEWINGSGIPGLGRALARHLLDGVDVYGGFAMNDMADRAFRKLGMTIIPEISRRVAVLDHDALAMLIEQVGFAKEARCLPAACTLPGRRWYQLAGTAVVPDRVLDFQAQSIPFAAGRSRYWLNWRYDRHPFISYAVIAADPDGDGGVAVARLEAVFGTSRVTCRVTEFMDAPGGGRALLEAVVGFARDHGALIADYFTTSATRARAFDAVTGAAREGVRSNPRVPYMYQPFAFNRRNAMNMVISTGGRAPRDIDLSGFHATKGDSDQDILRTPETAPAF